MHRHFTSKALLRLIVALIASAALFACNGTPPTTKEPPLGTPGVGGTLPDMTFATCDGSKTYNTADLKESGAKLLLLTGHTMW